jgi:alpha-L-rhamnosidase
VAVTVTTQRTYPSWGQWREHGATSLWEGWSDGARSRSHTMFVTVSQWLREHVAGVRPAAAGFARVDIRPLLGGGIDRASARHDTPLGTVAVAWRRDGGRVDLAVDLPSGVDAVLHTPAPVTLPPGRHRLGFGTSA